MNINLRKMHHNGKPLKTIPSLLVGLFFITNFAFAQDPQFSQIYASPLYHNPGMIGTGDGHRISINARNQWPNLPSSITTTALQYDVPINETRHNIGAMFVRDIAGNIGPQSTGFYGGYAYKLPVSIKWNLRFGMMAGYVQRTLGMQRLTFADQYSYSGVLESISREPSLTSESTSYFDLATGFVAHTRKVWVGLSAFHLTQPRQEWFGAPDRLPMRFTLTTGYKHSFGPYKWYRLRGVRIREYRRSITPMLTYRHQAPFKQLDLGAMFEYEGFLAGMWYRGLPIIAGADGAFNQDALIFMAGFKTSGLSFGYSYDYPLTMARPTGGAHEISLIIEFNGRPEPSQGLPCPKL